MSDTRKETVTLYMDDPDWPTNQIPMEFRRINWCKVHDTAKSFADYCWRVWAALLVTDEDLGECELVELWQEQPPTKRGT